MRRLFPALAAGALVLLMASPALAGEATLTDGGFAPAELTVAPGQTIVWTNASSAEHTVLAEDGTWDSGPLSPGDTFSITLRREGSYPYGTGDGAHSATITVSAEAAVDEPDDAPPDDAPVEDAPVTPVTGLPVLLLAGASAVLLLAGGTLVARSARRPETY